MNPRIVIVQEDKHYRVLFGHLRLANELQDKTEVCIDVKGVGKLKISKTSNGFYVKRKNGIFPVILY